jgi:hypothetical protein
MKQLMSAIRKSIQSVGVRRPEWDFVAVGYPKTGNTWTRIMLGRYVQLKYELAETPLFDHAEQRRLRLRGYRGAAGYFTHEPLEWTIQSAHDLSEQAVTAPLHAANRVVLLVRNPLDTLVSSFMHSKYKDPASPFPGGIEDFIGHGVMGLNKLIAFYRIWSAHVGSSKRILLWRYEDLKAKPEEQLSRLCSFLGIPNEDRHISEAVRFASFEELRTREEQGRDFVYESSGFGAFGKGQSSHKDAFHIRRGVVGGYRDEIPATLVEALEARVRTEMPEVYGYAD